MAKKSLVIKAARTPKFKSRKRDRARFRIPQRVKLVEGSVVIPKIGTVRIRQSQEVGETTRSTSPPPSTHTGSWYNLRALGSFVPTTGGQPCLAEARSVQSLWRRRCDRCTWRHRYCGHAAEGIDRDVCRCPQPRRLACADKALRAGLGGGPAASRRGHCAGKDRGHVSR